MSDEKEHLGFSITRISWDRPWESYVKIQTLFGKIVRGRKFQLNKLKNNRKYYLNVGCGENVHQDFINLDLYQKDKQGETVEFPYVNKQDLQNGFTPIMAVNRVFRNHGHLFAYDARTLKVMLKKIGFDDVRKENFLNGRDNSLLIDSEKRNIESLYIEAIAKKV